MHPSSTRLVRGVLAWLLLLQATGRAAPTLTRLEPASAPSRALVGIVGSNAEYANVIWDAGTANERVLPVNVGATTFSVPQNATPGTHAVALEDDSGRSQTFQFTVTGAPLKMGAPRVDHVMLIDPEFEDGQVAASLYVQGANIDVGAVVKINGVSVATVAHKSMRNNLYGVPQHQLGYPIHHYLALMAVPEQPLSAGSTSSITVVNLDNVASTPVPYVVPASAEGVDSDGDSLPDSLELAGIDADGNGTSDADIHRRDIFVELDIMAGLKHPLKQPDGTSPAIDAVRAMFAAAPFLNPYTANGINLVVDASETIPATFSVTFDGTANPANGSTTVLFSTLKAAHFTAARASTFHYVLWAQRMNPKRSGRSDRPHSPAPPFLPGDDVLIGLDEMQGYDGYHTTRSQAELLAHELGHNLAQNHGGMTDDEFNPNQWGVMTYAWTLRAATNTLKRRHWVTCLPFYYASAGASEPGGIMPMPVSLTIDYSAGMAARIAENSPLDERTGVCNQPADWNESGTIDTTPLMPPTDANDNGRPSPSDGTTDTIDDYSNWRALRFDGPKTNGTIP